MSHAASLAAEALAGEAIQIAGAEFAAEVQEGNDIMELEGSKATDAEDELKQDKPDIPSVAFRPPSKEAETVEQTVTEQSDQDEIALVDQEASRQSMLDIAQLKQKTSTEKPTEQEEECSDVMGAAQHEAVPVCTLLQHPDAEGAEGQDVPRPDLQGHTMADGPVVTGTQVGAPAVVSGADTDGTLVAVPAGNIARQDAEQPSASGTEVPEDVQAEVERAAEEEEGMKEVDAQGIADSPPALGSIEDLGGVHQEVSLDSLQEGGQMFVAGGTPAQDSAQDSSQQGSPGVSEGSDVCEFGTGGEAGQLADGSEVELGCGAGGSAEAEVEVHTEMGAAASVEGSYEENIESQCYETEVKLPVSFEGGASNEKQEEGPDEEAEGEHAGEGALGHDEELARNEQQRYTREVCAVVTGDEGCTMDQEGDQQDQPAEDAGMGELGADPPSSQAGPNAAPPQRIVDELWDEEGEQQEQEHEQGPEGGEIEEQQNSGREVEELEQEGREEQEEVQGPELDQAQQVCWEEELESMGIRSESREVEGDWDAVQQFEQEFGVDYGVAAPLQATPPLLPPPEEPLLRWSVGGRSQQQGGGGRNSKGGAGAGRGRGGGRHGEGPAQRTQAQHGSGPAQWGQAGQARTGGGGSRWQPQQAGRGAVAGGRGGGKPGPQPLVRPRAARIGGRAVRSSGGRGAAGFDHQRGKVQPTPAVVYPSEWVDTGAAAAGGGDSSAEQQGGATAGYAVCEFEGLQWGVQRPSNASASGSDLSLLDQLPGSPLHPEPPLATHSASGGDGGAPPPPLHGPASPAKGCLAPIASYVAAVSPKPAGYSALHRNRTLEVHVLQRGQRGYVEVEPEPPFCPAPSPPPVHPDDLPPSQDPSVLSSYQGKRNHKPSVADILSKAGVKVKRKEQPQGLRTAPPRRPPPQMAGSTPAPASFPTLPDPVEEPTPLSWGVPGRAAGAAAGQGGRAVAAAEVTPDTGAASQAQAEGEPLAQAPSKSESPVAGAQTGWGLGYEQPFSSPQHQALQHQLGGAVPPDTAISASWPPYDGAKLPVLSPDLPPAVPPHVRYSRGGARWGPRHSGVWVPPPTNGDPAAAAQYFYGQTHQEPHYPAGQHPSPPHHAAMLQGPPLGGVYHDGSQGSGYGATLPPLAGVRGGPGAWHAMGAQSMAPVGQQYGQYAAWERPWPGAQWDHYHGEVHFMRPSTLPLHHGIYARAKTQPVKYAEDGRPEFKL